MGFRRNVPTLHTSKGQIHFAAYRIESTRQKAAHTNRF